MTNVSGRPGGFSSSLLPLHTLASLLFTTKFLDCLAILENLHLLSKKMSQKQNKKNKHHSNRLPGELMQGSRRLQEVLSRWPFVFESIRPQCSPPLYSFPMIMVLWLQSASFSPPYAPGQGSGRNLSDMAVWLLVHRLQRPGSLCLVLWLDGLPGFLERVSLTFPFPVCFSDTEFLLFPIGFLLGKRWCPELISAFSLHYDWS